MEGSTGRRAGSESGKGRKLIKNALLLWAGWGSVQLGLQCRTHLRVIPCTPEGQGNGKFNK